MSGDIAALQSVWQSFPPDMTTSEKLARLNNQMVKGPPRDVARTAIRAVLNSCGTLEALNAYVAAPAQASLPALMAANYILAIVGYELDTLGDVFATSDPAVLQLASQLLPNLIADPATGVTQNTIDQLSALIMQPIPWWQAHGFSRQVTVHDLITAGNLF